MPCSSSPRVLFAQYDLVVPSLYSRFWWLLLNQSNPIPKVDVFLFVALVLLLEYAIVISFFVFCSFIHPFSRGPSDHVFQRRRDFGYLMDYFSGEHFITNADTRLYVGFLKYWYPHSWMVYKGKPKKMDDN